MARTFFVVSQMNPLIEELVKGLSESQNDLLIWTSKESQWQNIGLAKVITPFKRWSGKEFLQAIKYYFLQPASIYHFAVTGDDPGPTHAHWLMLSWAKLFKRSVIVSFLGPIHESRFWRAFAHQSDLVTFSSRDILLQANQKSYLKPGIKSDVFWARFPHVDGKVLTPSSLAMTVREKVGPFILIPWSQMNPPNPQWTNIFQSLGLMPMLLLNGDGFSSRTDFLSFSALSEQDCDGLAAAADWILLPYAELTLNQILNWRRRSLQGPAPLLISSKQFSLYPELCIPDRTGRVLNSNMEDLDWSVVLKKLPKNIDVSAQESKNQDIGVNSWTRIYRSLEMA